MYNDLLKFLSDEDNFFIEAEAKPDRMTSFINDYNKSYSPQITLYSDGIILLQDDANKRGLELRLYVRSCPPTNVKSLGFTHNNAYRSDYSYRLNDNKIIKSLLSDGYRIGLN
ncbi:MAG: hypothetical protein IJ797_04845 [Selenomonadaceae bacterium]|nr:hypothetical protein [Selenomonadaceae bacterium]